MDHPHSVEERAAATAVAALAADGQPVPSIAGNEGNHEDSASAAGFVGGVAYGNLKRDRDESMDHHQHQHHHADGPATSKMRMTHEAPRQDPPTVSPTMRNSPHHSSHSHHQQQHNHHQQQQQQQQQHHYAHHQSAPYAAAVKPAPSQPDHEPQQQQQNTAATAAPAGGAGAAAAAAMAAASSPDKSDKKSSNDGKVLRPYPYFYYRDFSGHPDTDPLTPLTQPGRVPNFVAKMHAILSRPDLVDVVAWMPHGRSWRVLKPREFEVRVIPTYFEHAKFSSFIRQANGWGFRRITQGRDRNSYYHEMFLRGLPHLCKMMKRPGVSEKQAADPEHEPDLYKISEEHPIPEKSEDDSVMLQCTLQGGPKARMPIYLGAFSSGMDANGNQTNGNQTNANGSTAYTNINPTPLNAINNQSTTTTNDNYQPSIVAPDSHIMEMNQFLSEGKTENTVGVNYAQQYLSNHTANNYGDFNSQVASSSSSNMASGSSGTPENLSSVAAAAYQASSAASQFAAGFAAATALSHQQLRGILQSLAAQGHHVTMPAMPTMSQMQQSMQQSMQQVHGQSQAQAQTHAPSPMAASVPVPSPQHQPQPSPVPPASAPSHHSQTQPTHSLHQAPPSTHHAPPSHAPHTQQHHGHVQHQAQASVPAPAHTDNSNHHAPVHHVPPQTAAPAPVHHAPIQQPQAPVPAPSPVPLSQTHHHHHSHHAHPSHAQAQAQAHHHHQQQQQQQQQQQPGLAQYQTAPVPASMQYQHAPSQPPSQQHYHSYPGSS